MGGGYEGGCFFLSGPGGKEVVLLADDVKSEQARKKNPASKEREGKPKKKKR